MQREPEIVDLTLDDSPQTRSPIRWPGKTIGAGIFVGRGGGSFINDPRYRKLGEYNARLVRTDIRDERKGIDSGIHIQANMPIAPGDEIYASYGRRGFKRAAPQGFGATSCFI
jgi:hypothetical protein